jgi:capsular polysaccharide biosynthesis protein
VTDNDLLAPPGDRRAVDGAVLVAALRRKRRMIVALAIIGACAGALVSLALPATPNATSLVYLRFPDGTDATQAMSTELTVLTSRAVAQSALEAMGSRKDPAALLSKYKGTIAGTGVLRVSATGRDAATARRRTDAVAKAYLAYRALLAQEQVDATVSALRGQQARLRQQIAADDAIINKATQGEQGQTYTDVVDDRQRSAVAVQQIDAEIQNDQVAAQSVAAASRVIDAAYVAPPSLKRTLATNAVTGLLVGLVLGIGGVLFATVVTTRLRRRADIAAALHAPVVLSVGRVTPKGWRRLVARKPSAARPNRDLERVVGHLDRTLTLTATRTLVVVSIDSLDVARLAVLTLARRLRDRGLAVSLVNETKEALRDSDARATGEHGGDIVLVLAVLDPADGAEHLREWGSTAVAIVTAGRSSESKLATNATMLRSASFDLGAVVLVGSDASDTTLGLVPKHALEPTGSVVDQERARTTVEST